MTPRIRHLPIHPAILLLIALALMSPVARSHDHYPAGVRLPLLVESAPMETTLDSDLPNASDIWLSLISQATESINLAEFYVSDDPKTPSRLTTILGAIRERAASGVTVRLLVEAKFYKTYPQWVTELDSLDGVEARRLNYQGIAGGVLHAKYFVVDEKTGYVGSQNFDWRALEHIQEIGVVLTDQAATRGLTAIFWRDWVRGMPLDTLATDTAPMDVPILGRDSTSVATGDDSNPTIWRLVASPKEDLPGGLPWDLPQLVEMIDSARDSIAVQLLTYKPMSRSGEMWDELDGALRRAAGRGVLVRLLLSNWGKRAGTVEHLQELSQVPGFELRFMNIPEWSGGFIPFARTVHAKYMVVDGVRFWLGTSNWERDYFYNSRNVGIVGDGRALGAELSQFFRNGWDSKYAEIIRADVTYVAPRIAE